MKDKINKIFENYSPIRTGSLVSYSGQKYRVISIDYPNVTIADWRDGSNEQSVNIQDLEFIT